MIARPATRGMRVCSTASVVFRPSPIIPTLPFIVLTGLDARSSTMTPKRPVSRRTLALTSATLASLVALGALAPFGRALAADTIKVGVLHSLSGTMAISETTLKDTALMTIAEINAHGGVLGRQLEPVVVDPASN